MLVRAFLLLVTILGVAAIVIMLLQRHLLYMTDPNPASEAQLASAGLALWPGHVRQWRLLGLRQYSRPRLRTHTSRCIADLAVLRGAGPVPRSVRLALRSLHKTTTRRHANGFSAALGTV